MEIVKLVKSGAGFSAISAACTAAGINALIRVYVGQQRGTTSAVPSQIGSYRTHNHGELTSFTVSTAKPGDVVEYKGDALRVIVNEFAQGDAWVPSNYWFVAEKIEVQ